jgi:hypothetical protein
VRGGAGPEEMREGRAWGGLVRMFACGGMAVGAHAAAPAATEHVGAGSVAPSAVVTEHGGAGTAASRAADGAGSVMLAPAAAGSAPRAGGSTAPVLCSIAPDTPEPNSSEEIARATTEPLRMAY